MDEGYTTPYIKILNRVVRGWNFCKSFTAVCVPALEICPGGHCQIPIDLFGFQNSYI